MCMQGGVVHPKKANLEKKEKYEGKLKLKKNNQNDHNAV